MMLGVFFISNVNTSRAESGSDDSSYEDESGKDESDDDISSDDEDDNEVDDSGMDSESDLDDSDEDDSFNRPIKKVRSEAPFFLKRIAEEKPTLLDNRIEVREKIVGEDGSINKGKGSISDTHKIFDMSEEEGIRARGLVAMRFTTAIGNLERMSVRIDSATTKLGDKGYDMSEAKSLFEGAMDDIDEARVQVEEFRCDNKGIRHNSRRSKIIRNRSKDFTTNCSRRSQVNCR
jgi:hypothetical protein